ncbi:hypothetical protein TW80_02830 [Loktanella sp. S4079]|nr:hypothetical protein TW80_02830 [Loktanella sp. S4079]
MIVLSWRSNIIKDDKKSGGDFRSPSAQSFGRLDQGVLSITAIISQKRAIEKRRNAAPKIATK